MRLRKEGLLRRLASRRSEERGAILVMAAVGVVLSMIAGGLAIDLGRLAQAAREDQKIADLAALDAVRGAPAEYQSLAEASALRNGFPLGEAGYSLTAVEGNKVSGTCQSVPGAGSACVTVTSPHTNAFPFVSGSDSLTRVGVAAKQARGGFSIGSSLATIDSNRSTVLNSFMGGMLKGSSIGAGVVSWQGLLTGNVTLEALRTQLLTMNPNVGTVEELLDADFTVAQIFQATAQALALQGPTAAAQLTALNALRGQVTATTLTTVKLGRFMEVEQGGEEMALGSSLNVFQLATATAQVANGTNLINISNVGITFPGVGPIIKASLKVIEPPKFYFGPVGGSVSTSQVELSVTPTLDLPISVVGLTGARVTQELPIKITAGAATGTLTDVDCGASTMTVTADLGAMSGSASTTLRVSANVLFVNIPVLDVPTTSVLPSTPGGSHAVVFDYPEDFPPPLGTETTEHRGSRPLGLDGLMTFQQAGPVTVLGALSVPTGNVVSAVLNALPPVVGNLDTRVLSPVLAALGIDIGGADISPRAMRCGIPTLVG